MKKIKDILLVVISAVLIFSISLICLAKSDSVYSAGERRELASSPKLNAQTISNGEFMKEFELYSTDQFPQRERLRGLKSAFSIFVLGRADSNGLFVRDGHISKLDNAESEDMKNYAAAKFNSVFKKYFADNGSKAYFSIIPDKNFILAEPNGYPSLNYKGFAEDMKGKLSDMQYIDIYDYLSLDDYYPTDSHWRQEKITDIAEHLANKMGTDAKAEYKENILPIPFDGVYKGQLALPFKSDTIVYLTNDTIDSAKVCYYDTGKAVEGEMYDMKKAQGKDAYELFLSGSSPIVTMENQNAASDRELVIFRDSFGGSLAPLMLEGYKKVSVIDIRYVRSDFLGSFMEFGKSDVLFIYSTGLINSSTALQ